MDETCKISGVKLDKPVDQWGCGCTHGDQSLGHIYPCPKAPMPKGKPVSDEYEKARSKPYPRDHKYTVFEDGTVVSRYTGKPMSVIMYGDKKRNALYPAVSIRINGKSLVKKLSHMVLETFVGPRPDGLQGAHLDGNKYNNHLSNLKWCSRSENERHKTLHGTSTASSSGKRGAIKLSMRGRGISKNAHGSTWNALVCIKRKTIYLGCYRNEELALAARKGAMMLAKALRAWE